MPPARKNTVDLSPSDGEWVSLLRASEILGCTRHSVLQRALAGELQAQVIAGRTVVLRRSIEDVLARTTAVR